jgi:hypothetical protein
MPYMSRKFESPFFFLCLIIFFVFTMTSCWESESRGISKGSDTKNDSYSPNISPTSTPAAENSTMTNNAVNKPENNSSEEKKEGFDANLPKDFSTPSDAVGKRMLKEYGAMFVAKNGVVPPNKVVFNNEAEVSAWQSSVSKSNENVGGISIELQTPAMNALKEAINEAKQSNLTVSPNGADSAKRDYNGTVTNWNSRVNPGFTHWVGKGRVPQAEATHIKSLPIPEQIGEIFRLEEQGIYFAKSLDKSIIYSVAPPGTSQHISMLALDVKEHGNAKVREILANHGWFQTVVSDLPHFTYLGAKESDLPGSGLKKVSDGGRAYWIPSI